MKKSLHMHYGQSACIAIVYGMRAFRLGIHTNKSFKKYGSVKSYSAYMCFAVEFCFL